MKFRECTKCLLVKSKSQFSVEDIGWCDSCCIKASNNELIDQIEKERGVRNLRRMSISRNREIRRLKIEDPEKYLIAVKQRYRETLYKKYGLTTQEVEEQGEFQDWRCVICGRDIRNRFHIDHDHQTGRFRGLLCFNCNIGLGNFRDSITNLIRAAEYLQNFEN